MANIELAAKLKLSIKQKIENFSALAKLRDQAAANANTNPLYRALIEAMISSMASIMDYYCIYCVISISPTLPQIRKIQYRPIGKKQLIEAIKGKTISLPREKSELSLHSYKKAIEEEIKNRLKVEPKNINEHAYWTIYFGYATNKVLKDYGVIDEEFSFEIDPEYKAEHENIEVKFNSVLRQYHESMRAFRKYPKQPHGTSYDIYLSANNCIKHNKVIDTKNIVAQFDNPSETREYKFFEIDDSDYVFMGEGVLKKILTTSHQKLKDCLEFKSTKGDDELSPLEEEWETGCIIRNGTQEDFTCNDKDILFFFIDQALLAKTKTSTLIETHETLKNTFGSLLSNIEHGIRIIEKTWQTIINLEASLPVLQFFFHTKHHTQFSQKTIKSEQKPPHLRSYSGATQPRRPKPDSSRSGGRSAGVYCQAGGGGGLSEEKSRAAG